MRNPAGTVLGAVAVFFITIFLALTVSVSSLTEVENDEIQLYITMPTGSSLQKTDETVQNRITSYNVCYTKLLRM